MFVQLLKLKQRVFRWNIHNMRTFDKYIKKSISFTKGLGTTIDGYLPTTNGSRGKHDRYGYTWVFGDQVNPK